MKKQSIAFICLIAAIVCAFMAVTGYRKEQNAGKSYEALRESVTITKEREAAEESEPVKVSGADEEKKEEQPEIPIDFEELQRTCPDAYAWIVVPDTKVDYPIVQSPTDNAFYMDHNPMGEYEFAGAIFTEDYNTKTFEDPNTLIYGHNMKNGSMFKELHKFEDKEFFEKHPYFTIYTPDQVLTYQVFAAYTYDNRHIMKEFDFTDREVFQLYLQSILEQKSMSANIARDVEVTADDKIVTLSTCNGINEQRYLVQGVLLSE